jgi:hypothetical protein
VPGVPGERGMDCGQRLVERRRGGGAGGICSFQRSSSFKEGKEKQLWRQR